MRFKTCGLRNTKEIDAGAAEKFAGPQNTLVHVVFPEQVSGKC